MSMGGGIGPCPECAHSAARCSTCGGYEGYPSPPQNITVGPCRRCIGAIGEPTELPLLALTNDAPTVDPEAPTEVLSLDEALDEQSRYDAEVDALLRESGDSMAAADDRIASHVVDAPGPRNPSLLDSAARYHASGATVAGGRSYLSYQGEIADALRQLGGIDAEIARQCAESMLAAVQCRLKDEQIKRGVE